MDRVALEVGELDVIAHHVRHAERGQMRRGVLQRPGELVGDVVEAKFTGLDRKNRVISLSIKAKEAHEEAEAVESYRSSDTTSGTTLGDLLKERIAEGGEG